MEYGRQIFAFAQAESGPDPPPTITVQGDGCVGFALSIAGVTTAVLAANMSPERPAYNCKEFWCQRTSMPVEKCRWQPHNHSSVPFLYEVARFQPRAVI